MPELRWILIVCGALLLLGIYLWGRRGSRPSVAGDDAMLRIAEPLREPQGAHALRGDEPSAGFDPPTAPQTAMLDIGTEPIVAKRRYRDEPGIELGGDEDTVDVAEPAVPRARDARRTRIEPTLGAELADELPPLMSATTPLRSDQSLNPSVGRSFDSPGDFPADRPADPSVDRSVSAARTSPPPVALAEPAASAVAAPTLSMSSTPLPRRTERRKIIALRISAASPRFTGTQLLEALQAEELQHGKYEVFHRLGDGGASLFSIASMVEPGTFEPVRMQDETYPGITLFAQFPGPVDALPAFDDMLSCARRLHERLGGTLQDERGVPLTVHRVERLRQELRDFEHGHARDNRHADSAP